MATASDLLKAFSEFTYKKKAVSLPDTLFINGIPTSDPSKIINGAVEHLFPKAMIDPVPPITNRSWMLPMLQSSL